MIRFILSKGLSIHRLGSIKIYKKQQCSKIITKTVSKMQQVAEITFGPFGRNVIIDCQMQNIRITKDGVTVVKHIQFKNRMQDAVCTLIKKSVDGTNKYAGDGTTTSMLLIGEIMKLAAKKIQCGVHSRQIRKGLEIARAISIQFLESCARKISTREQLLNVAMIATNRKEQISKLVVEALLNSNRVVVQKSQKLYNSIQYHQGIKIGRGIQAKQFVNTNKQKIVYNYPFVVVSMAPVKLIKDVLGCLELAKKARKQLIIFAPDFSDAVKSTLIYNNVKKTVECACVSVPLYGDMGEKFLKQISQITNSYLFTEYSEHKIQSIDWDKIGKAVKIEVDKLETSIKVQQKQNNKNLQAIIMVGGPNQTAMLENYDHIIDALNSTKSAMKDGVVAGGGVTFWRLSDLLSSYQGEGQEGVKILAEVLKQPRTKLMQYIPSEKKPLSGELWQGYDLKQQKIVDMFEAGIIDSVNVAKSVIIDSISLCTVLVEVEIGLGRVNKNISTTSLKDLNRNFSL